MKYKVTVEQLEEYPEMETVYESTSSGTRYYSVYHSDLKDLKLGKDYIKKEYPTGKTLDRVKEIYVQEYEADSIVEVIKAVNALK